MFKYWVFFIVLITLSSCNNRKKESFCITYRVTNYMSESESLLISYRDSNEYVSVYITDHHWSKEVCLPADEFAALSIIPQTTLASEKGKRFGNYAYLKEPRITVRGEIIHQNKTISKYGTDMVSLSLFPLEL